MIFDFLRKKKNDVFVRGISPEGRNEIIAVFYKNLSELYGSNARALRVPVGNFDIIKNRFYFEAGKEILRLLKANIKLEKHGENATDPKDRYFLFTTYE